MPYHLFLFPSGVGTVLLRESVDPSSRLFPRLTGSELPYKFYKDYIYKDVVLFLCHLQTRSQTAMSFPRIITIVFSLTFLPKKQSLEKRLLESSSLMSMLSASIVKVVYLTFGVTAYLDQWGSYCETTQIKPTNF
jgi:hypothetical protein